MITPLFDLLDFAPMSWDEWKFHYFSDIRVSHELDKLKNPKVGLVLADKKTKIYLPHYEDGGNWRYGKPKQIRPGDRLALIRTACVKYKERYLILDAVHRITQVNPSIILLDYVEIKENERKLVTDLISDFWEKI